jgi:hypothetical protein
LDFKIQSSKNNATGPIQLFDPRPDRKYGAEGRKKKEEKTQKNKKTKQKGTKNTTARLKQHTVPTTMPSKLLMASEIYTEKRLDHTQAIYGPMPPTYHINHSLDNRKEGWFVIRRHL